MLLGLLKQLGYYTAIELELRILSDWHPKPDEAAASFREQPYDTKPIEIAAEVLSPTDQPGEVNEKCRNYEKCGIGQIYMFDPEKRTAEIWMADRLIDIEMLRLPNGVTYPVSAIWTELDRRMA